MGPSPPRATATRRAPAAMPGLTLETTNNLCYMVPCQGMETLDIANSVCWVKPISFGSTGCPQNYNPANDGRCEATPNCPNPSNYVQPRQNCEYSPPSCASPPGSTTRQQDNARRQAQAPVRHQTISGTPRQTRARQISLALRFRSPSAALHGIRSE